MNDTHDPKLKSWVESANSPDTDFPIQNLPFGVFRNTGETPCVGVAIGDSILDLAAAGLAREASSLNELMAHPPADLRERISRLLRSDASPRPELLVPQSEVTMELPASIGDYSDFYASIHHATNVGSMFRPDNPLLPNYKYIPIGYHGRASSIVVSGTEVRRPCGQLRSNSEAPPEFGPSRLLDYELEVGMFIGRPNNLGSRIPIDSAERHLFGLCLVNDWSARDIQSWEYQPLGPFLAKSFATTVSPWVVTIEALEPFRSALPPRPSGDPGPLPYLSWGEDKGIDITLEVFLESERMRSESHPPFRLSRTSFINMYWTPAQLVTHHASNGCNLRPGDLLASGTVSGPADGERGCLLELTWRGAKPLKLPTGEERKFLADGDAVIFRACCEKDGYRRIGFGECRGVVLPATA